MELKNEDITKAQKAGNDPLVSVLMTSYNRDKYIAEAIESVLNSEYTNFELIISDDASTDNTLAIARHYETKDNRIRVCKNDKNLGQFGNRNKAASYARGMYLKYVDSDDIIYTYTLKMMVDAMETYKEAGMAFCLTHGPCKKPLPYVIKSEEALEQHFFEGGLLFCGPTGLIFKKEAFEFVGRFEEFGMPSDNHLALKIASHYPVVAITRDLFWWRQHSEQVFSLNKGNYLNIFNNYAYTKNVINNHARLNPQKKQLIITNQKKIFFSNIIRLIIKGKIRNAINLLSLFVKEKS